MFIRVRSTFLVVVVAFRLARAGGDMPPEPEEVFNEATKSSRPYGISRHSRDFLAPAAAPASTSK
jgi:hypothetical protein